LGEPLAIERGAGDCRLKGIVKPMDEYQQVSSWLAQIGNYIVTEVPLLDISYTRDHSRLVGGELGIVDKGNSISDWSRIGGRDDAGAVASPVLGRAVQGTVRREIHCGGRHLSAPLGHEGGEPSADPCVCSHWTRD